MSKLFSCLLLSLLLFANACPLYAAESVWDGKTIATGFYSGTGTKSSPYTIYTASQFAYFYKEMANGRTFEGQYISLKNDIDMTEKQLSEMDGIQTSSFSFYGNFDGEDHSLAAKIGWFGYSGPWIFGRVYGTIHNLLFSKYATFSASVESGGEMYNCKFEKAMMMAINVNFEGTVANCYCNDSQTWQNGSKYGGSSGFLTGSGNCLNCHFTGMSYISYGGSTASNYGSYGYGNIREYNGVSDEEHNLWVSANSTSSKIYKTWPMTFTPTYPSYTVNVSFVDESGFTNYSSVNRTAGTNYTLPTPSGFESEFLGWEVNGEIVKSFIPTDNTVCKAVWKHSFVKQPTLLCPTATPKDKTKATTQWYRMDAKNEILSNTVSSFEVEHDNTTLEFDYKVWGSAGGYSSDGYDGYLYLDGATIAYCYNGTKEGHYEIVLSKGKHIISRDHAETKNITLCCSSFPVGTANSDMLEICNIIPANGVYYCEATYGSEKLYSDTLDTSDLFYVEDMLYAHTGESEAAFLKSPTDAATCLIPLMVNNSIEYTITGISEYAFAGCSALKKIICMQTEPLAISASAVNSVFQNVNKSTCRLLVPTSAISKYQTAIGWKDFSTIKSSTIVPVKIYLGSSLAISKNTDIDEILEQDVSHNGLVYIDDQDVDQTLPSNFIKKDESNLWIASGITLTDAQPLYVPDDVKTDVLTYSRTFSNTEWQALYVPFAMTYDDWAEEFEVARISGMHMYDYDEDGEVDETSLEILRVKKGALLPNTPYLIHAKETGEKTIALSDAVLYATDENSYDVSTWDYRFTFTGTYATIPGTTMVADGYYALGGGTLHQAEEASNDLKPFRWYMAVTDRRSAAPAPSKVVLHLVGEEDLTTGIVTPLQPQDAPLDAPCYDLSGRRVTIPTKGVFIKNGKKTIVR